MKPVIKIDFKTEHLMVKQNQSYIELFELNGKDVPWETNRRPSASNICVKTKIYNIYESRNTNRGDLYYAVEDKELLYHLFQIGENYLEELKRHSKEVGYSNGNAEGFRNGVNKTTEKIKNLSWWKRLLGRF